MPPLPIIPDNVSPAITALIERLVPGGQSIYLSIEPVEGAVENECYGNVDRAIARAGGAIRYGWKLWETLPGVMAEAEFHAVWVDLQSVMHEVSQAPMPYMDRILFLPDPERTYAGQQIDNIRIPLKEDPLIDAFITSSEKYFEVMNRGELADVHGYVVLTEEMKGALAEQQARLIAILTKYYPSSFQD